MSTGRDESFFRASLSMATVHDRVGAVSDRDGHSAVEGDGGELTGAEKELDELFRQRTAHRRVRLSLHLRLSRQLQRTSTSHCTLAFAFVRIVPRRVSPGRVRGTRARHGLEEVLGHERRARPGRLDDPRLRRPVREAAVVVVVCASARQISRFVSRARPAVPRGGKQKGSQRNAPMMATIWARSQIARGTLWSTRAIPLMRCHISDGCRS